MRYIQGMAVGGIALYTPTGADGPEMAALMRSILGETEFLNREPEEFVLTDAEESAYLDRMERSFRECVIAARFNGKLVGNAIIREAGETRRVRHRATLGIAVLRETWGRGVGSMLMDAAIQTAQSAGYRQLELSVAADNERAIRLYGHWGFEEYGRCPGALRRADGSYADEILMVKPLM